MCVRAALAHGGALVVCVHSAFWRPESTLCDAFATCLQAASPDVSTSPPKLVPARSSHGSSSVSRDEGVVVCGQDVQIVGCSGAS